MKKIFLFLTCVLCLTGCSSGGGEDTPKDPIKQPDPVITIPSDKTSINLIQGGDKTTVSFKATSKWAVTVAETRAADWLTVSPMSGEAGDVTLTVSASSNEGTDDRKATVTIKSGNISKSFTVTQKQKDALTVTANRIEADPEGETVAVEVKANIDFQYAIDEAAKGWIAYVGTKALTTSTLNFQISANDTKAAREGKITISSGSFKEVVTIVQQVDAKLKGDGNVDDMDINKW